VALYKLGYIISNMAEKRNYTSKTNFNQIRGESFAEYMERYLKNTALTVLYYRLK
jgi:hypothetical protein